MHGQKNIKKRLYGSLALRFSLLYGFVSVSNCIPGLTNLWLAGPKWHAVRFLWYAEFTAVQNFFNSFCAASFSVL